jgi:prolipoprotein diacylglyceryltransferase
LFNGWGAAAGALIAALWYGQKYQLDYWSTLDLFTPAFATLSLFIGLAHLASGSAFGSASDLPWSIELWGARRHPTQIYEMISAALVLTIILKMFSSKKILPKGILFLTFLILTTASRLFLEAFRGDSQMIGNVRTAQLAAWLILAVSLFLFGKRFFQPADQKNRDEISQTG